jgi:hypothetical protein
MRSGRDVQWKAAESRQPDSPEDGRDAGRGPKALSLKTENRSEGSRFSAFATLAQWLDVNLSAANLGLDLHFDITSVPLTL